MSDIAVVGYSLKLPQDINDDESFWDALQNRRNLMTKWPENRVKTDSFANNKHQKWNGSGGHFINDDVASFDAPLFSVTAKEASSMDPMQRWTLEVTYHALENSGMPVESLKGTRTAVFSASMLEDYSRMTAVDPDNLERTAVTGSTVSCIIPNRVSWYFDLRGPSIHVNTACSSSLSAVDMACKVLTSGDSSCAIVTGANLLLDPSIFQVLANQGFLSPDGICYSFDERANGYSRGEGVIALILKPIDTAIENGDTIRAVIRSIASNQDGHTPILTQPSSQAQEELIRHVYEKAGLSMNETRYVEAHGTGTPVGDPIEMKAIGRCFKGYRSSLEPLYVGSVKGNIGHLEGASALASLIKCILVLEKGVIPPNAMLQKINPKLETETYNIEIPTTSIPWPVDGTRRLSINSFGFGGSNTHVVLDDALHYMRSKELEGMHNTSVKTLMNGVSDTNGCREGSINDTNGVLKEEPDNLLSRLFVFSAADELATHRTTEAYRKFYQEKVTGNSERLNDLASTLGSRRSKMLWRAFAVTDGLNASQLSVSEPIRSSKDPGLAYVFTGQGAQYLNMGMGLTEYPIYKETLQKINDIYSNLGCPWNLFEELDCSENINKPEYSQPLSTAVQIALIELLASFGIRPKVVIGHSSGEIAAAYSCGALTLESACKVSYFRGLLAGKLRAANVTSPGAMISINLPADQVSEFLARKSIMGVNIACINSSLNSTLSGPESDIDAVKDAADADGIYAQKLKTGVAYHSPFMNTISEEYLTALQDLGGKDVLSAIPMISTVTGKAISHDALCTAEYWVDNMLSTVKFSQAILMIANRGTARTLGFGHITDIVEIGPHPALRRPVKDTLEDIGNDTKRVRYNYALHRSDYAPRTILNLAGQLFCHGYLISIPATNRQASKQGFLIGCPKYPFDRSQRYWAESRISRDFRLREPVKGDLLGVRASDWNPLEPRWRNFWSIDSSPWVGDHKISDTILFPASAMLIMAIEAVQEMVSDTDVIFGYLLETAEFKKPIIIPEAWEGRIETQVSLRSAEALGRRFDVTIFTYSQNEWLGCFSAKISLDYNSKDGDWQRQRYQNKLSNQYEKVKDECTLPVDSRDFYDAASEAGLQYGDGFRLLHDVQWNGKTSAIALVNLSNPEFDTSSLSHPAVLDQAFQVLRVGSCQQRAANIPVRLNNAWFSSKPWNTNSVKWMAESIPTVHGYGEQGRVVALSEDGEILCCFEQAVTSAVSEEVTKTEKKLVYSIEWKPQLSMLSSEQLATLCHDNSTPKDERAVLANHSKMCRTLELVAARVLKSIDKSKVPTDLQRHVEWMEHHVSKLSSEQQQEADEIKDNELEAGLDKIDSVLPAWKLYTTCARRLPEILTGELDPLQVVFESDQADIFYSDLFRNLCADGQLNYVLDLAAHENPSLRILEVGAGTGGMTGHVISALQERERRTGGLAFSEYTYTDISPAFFEAASTNWPDLVSQGRVTFRTFDLDRTADSQGFELGSYDLIIAASVLHATPYLDATIRNVHRCLKPSGKLILVEVINPDDIATNFMAGLVPGWWVAREEWRPHSAAIPEHLWHKCLQENGFSGNDLVIRDYQDDQCHIMSVIVTTAKELSQPLHARGRNERLIIIVSNEQYSKSIALAKDVLSKLELEKNRHTSIVPFSGDILRDELVDLTTDDYVICLAEAGKPLLANLSEESFSCLQFLISKVSNLLWVTSTRFDDPNSPAYAVAQGFFRSIRAEQTDTHIVTLAIEDYEFSNQQPEYISQVFESAFGAGAHAKEVEYRVKKGIITTGRAVHDMTTDSSLRSLVSKQSYDKPWSEGPALKLSMIKPGNMDSLQFVEDELETSDLAAHDIEIEAHAWSLTNRDLQIALGSPGSRTELFGNDCAGVVTGVGSQCDTSIQPGDRVGIIIRGCMRKYPRAHEACVIKLPDAMSFEDAATLMSPALTAYYVVFDVARVQQNDNVLVHSTTTGAGQFAVRLLKTLGARVFIVSPSQQERQVLVDNLGIPVTDVFDSSSFSSSRDLLLATEGYEIDVVLDFSGGDALQTPVSSLADGGRLIIDASTEKLDRDISKSLLAGNITFASVDISSLSHKTMQRLIERTMRTLVNGNLQWPRFAEAFSLSRVKDAFGRLQGADNVDRVVLTVNPNEDVPQFIQDRRSWTFDSNATFLIAGGFGGLGRAIIKWMADRGARNFIVPSRSGATSEAATRLLSELTSRRVKIIAPKCDLSIREDVEVILADCICTMPPIKGCINAAMVLQDAIFQTNMTFKQWDFTIRSKINTSKNLDELLPKDLDFFILLSSLAGVVGQMASANYAGGCAYQDALVRHRIMHGQKAVSLDIGWMRNIGIIAESETYQRQRQTSNDMQPIDDTELLALLTLCCDPDRPLELLRSSQGQILFGLRTPSDVLKDGQKPPEVLQRPLFDAFSYIVGREDVTDRVVNEAEDSRGKFLKTSDSRERQQIVVRAIAIKLARAMSISPDDVEPSKPLSTYGVDSLMAVELRNWINKEFSTKVAVFDIIGGVSIASVAETVEKQSLI